MAALGALALSQNYGVAGFPTSSCTVYPTAASSDAWMAQVSQLPLPQQVAALRRRVACDAGVHGRAAELAVCLSCVSAESRRTYQALAEQRRLADAADPRPRGVVLFCLVDGRPLAAGELALFQRVVTKKTVREITFVPSDQAAAMAGARAADGLVMVTTEQ